MREEGCFNIHGKQLPTSKILLIFIHWKPISTTIQWNTGLNTNERLTLECVTVCLMNLCVSIGVFPMSTQNCITGLCSTLFENVFFSDDENSMHHYIFFSLIDVKFLDYDVIIFSAYSVIIFGINSLKSIAIYKICTLVFFIHNVKMWNPLYIVCYALHQNFTLISIFKILFIAIIRANWFYGFRN